MTKIFRLLLTTIALLGSASAFGACPGAKTLFYCQLENRKQVQICRAGGSVTYSFGRSLANPEIKLVKRFGQAYAENWHAIGPEHYGLEIPHGSTTYRAYQGTESTESGVNTLAGIRVERKQRTSDYACKTDTLISNLEDNSLPERPDAH